MSFTVQFCTNETEKQSNKIRIFTNENDCHFSENELNTDEIEIFLLFLFLFYKTED